MADHTLNTLRYAERLKERSGLQNASQFDPRQIEEELAVAKRAMPDFQPINPQLVSLEKQISNITPKTN